MRETVIGLLWPFSAAMSPQELRSIKGATFKFPALPPVVEIKAPSADQESRLNKLWDSDWLL